MKLEYGSTTLGDDAAGDFILDDGGDHQRLAQVTPLAGGATVSTIARENRSNTRTFTVSKEHADLAAAATWFNQHPDSLAADDELKITEGSSVSKMADAVLTAVQRVQLTGKSTVIRYQFTGGQIVAATP